MFRNENTSRVVKWVLTGEDGLFELGWLVVEVVAGVWELQTQRVCNRIIDSFRVVTVVIRHRVHRWQRNWRSDRGGGGGACGGGGRFRRSAGRRKEGFQPRLLDTGALLVNHSRKHLLHDPVAITFWVKVIGTFFDAIERFFNQRSNSG